MTHDPYDTDKRTVTGSTPPEDTYLRRSYGSGYGSSGIAFVIFGVVAVLLIGFAMFGGYPNNDTVNAPTTTEQTAPQVQPEQPAAPETNAPANNTGTTNQQ